MMGLLYALFGKQPPNKPPRSNGGMTDADCRAIAVQRIFLRAEEADELRYGKDSIFRSDPRLMCWADGVLSRWSMPLEKDIYYEMKQIRREEKKR